MNPQINKQILEEIQDVTEQGNFQTVKNMIGENRLRVFFNEVYPFYSLPELERISGIPDSTLGYWLSRLGILTSRRHITNVSIPANFNGIRIMKKGMQAKKFSAVHITPELAYLIGFSLGDGNIQQYSVEVFNQDKNIKTHLLTLLRPYGIITQDVRSDGLWRLRLSSGKIANLIKVGRHVRDDTLDYIFRDESLAVQFIAAFWDAEGTVRKQGKYCHIYLYNTNHLLLDSIGAFLNNKGVSFSTFEHKMRPGKVMLKGRIVNSKKSLRRISIPKHSALLWAQLIGSHLRHSKKCNVIKELVNSEAK